MQEIVGMKLNNMREEYCKYCQFGPCNKDCDKYYNTIEYDKDK